jgi:acyl-coenzyme A synthetase/AMP-(fatty) acid ligase
MDIRKKFRVNIFLNTLSALGLAVTSTIVGMFDNRYEVKCTIFAVALIGVIVLINKAMLQVEHLDKISYDQGLKTFRNTLKTND